MGQNVTISGTPPAACAVNGNAQPSLSVAPAGKYSDQLACIAHETIGPDSR
jgi:hypothetical protein